MLHLSRTSTLTAGGRNRVEATGLLLDRKSSSSPTTTIMPIVMAWWEVRMADFQRASRTFKFYVNYNIWKCFKGMYMEKPSLVELHTTLLHVRLGPSSASLQLWIQPFFPNWENRLQATQDSADSYNHVFTPQNIRGLSQIVRNPCIHCHVQRFSAEGPEVVRILREAQDEVPANACNESGTEFENIRMQVWTSPASTLDTPVTHLSLFIFFLCYKR